MEWRCPMQHAMATVGFRALVVGGAGSRSSSIRVPQRASYLIGCFTRPRLAVQGDCRRRPERRLAGG